MEALPLGAVRASDGSVVVPESRRADGSVRKPIRIRQGYVPQDEVPKYKPIGQRMREQQAKEQKEARGTSHGSADAVAEGLRALSLESAGSSASSSSTTKTHPVSPPPPPARVAEKHERAARPQGQRQGPKSSSVAPPMNVAAASTKELKSELSAVNKSLREIAKLEAFDAAFARGDDGARPLTAPQKRKVERKAQLERRRQTLVMALDAEKKPGSDGESEVQDQQAKPKTLRVIEL